MTAGSLWPSSNQPEFHERSTVQELLKRLYRESSLCPSQCSGCPQASRAFERRRQDVDQRSSFTVTLCIPLSVHVDSALDILRRQGGDV